MSIADKLALLNNTKNAIAAAIESKGVLIDGAPFADYPSKIEQISGAPQGWQRPSDWLELPEVLPTDQKLVALVAVFPNANFMALSAAGDYVVDWGDGTVENIASGVVAEHEYNYATYDTNNETLSTLGYKQAILTITPQSGQALTSVILHRRHSAISTVFTTGYLEIAVGSPSLTELQIGVFNPEIATQAVLMNYLEKVTVVSSALTNLRNLFFSCRCLVVAELNTTGIGVTAVSMFSNCYALKEIILPDTSEFISTASMFFNCVTLVEAPLFDTSKVTNAVGMFNTCYSLKKVPVYDTSEVLDMSYMFRQCASLTEVPLLNTSKVTNMSSMFDGGTGGMSNLKEPPLFDTSSVTSAIGMFSYCRALTKVPAYDFSSLTSTTSIFTSCPSLSQIDIVGIAVSFSVANCKLSSQELNKIYANLGTVESATITVTGVYGAAGADPSIATAKGWTVNG